MDIMFLIGAYPGVRAILNGFAIPAPFRRRYLRRGAILPQSSPFGTFGRYTEISTDQLTPDQKKAYDKLVAARGQVPGPYKIILQNPKLLELLIPLGVYFQLDHSSLAAHECEIATNMINAKWRSAYSNYEHEMIADKAGIPADKIEHLIAGLPTSFDDPRQQVIYEMTAALIESRHVPTGVYRRAVDLLGDAGLTDLTVLIGYFTMISLTLAAYDVPADAVGIKR